MEIMPSRIQGGCCDQQDNIIIWVNQTSKIKRIIEMIVHESIHMAINNAEPYANQYYVNEGEEK